MASGKVLQVGFFLLLSRNHDLQETALQPVLILIGVCMYMYVPDLALSVVKLHKFIFNIDLSESLFLCLQQKELADV